MHIDSQPTIYLQLNSKKHIAGNSVVITIQG